MEIIIVEILMRFRDYATQWSNEGMEDDDRSCVKVAKSEGKPKKDSARMSSVKGDKFVQRFIGLLFLP